MTVTGKKIIQSSSNHKIYLTDKQFYLFTFDANKKMMIVNVNA